MNQPIADTPPAEKGRDEAKTVFVVTYRHRHGINTTACATAELAWKSAANDCIENLGDLEWKSEKFKNRLRALYRAGEYRAVVGKYEDAWRYCFDNEEFEVDRLEVLTEVPTLEAEDEDEDEEDEEDEEDDESHG